MQTSQTESDSGPDREEVVVRAEVAQTQSRPPKPGNKRPSTAKHGRYHSSMDPVLTNQELYMEHLEQMMKKDEDEGSQAQSDSHAGTESVGETGEDGDEDVEDEEMEEGETEQEEMM